LMDPQDVGRPDGPRQTCSVSWDLDPDKLIRPRSADSIKACGRYAAPIGRTHDRKRLLLFITPKVLADRGPSTHETVPFRYIYIAPAKSGEVLGAVIDKNNAINTLIN